MQKWLQLALLVLLLGQSIARKHHLEIRNDYRRYIALSTFGFYRDGILDVNFHNFQLTKPETTKLFGLSLDKTMTDAMNPYLDTHQDKCILTESAEAQRRGPIMFFKMVPAENVTKITCSKEWKSLHIYKNRSDIPITSMLGGRGLEKVSDSSLFLTRNRRAVVKEIPPAPPVLDSAAGGGGCGQMTLPLTSTFKDGVYSFSFNFIVFIASEEEEGLYNLYFHSCPNYDYFDEPVALNFNVEIEENNHGNYLSAGEMPLPALYFMMSILFLLSGIFWVFILRKSKHPVFKIHYLMAGLVFLKSLSLFFHAINFHFIEIKGEHVAAWAILYYITHLMKGAVLFTTIVLIGTGWTIIKHFLTDRDKKIFMIIIPLQVLANIADIILAESEEGDIEHRTWADILILVDLIIISQFLNGANYIDRHFRTTKDIRKNIPLLLGLIGFYNTTILNLESRAILPYSQALSKLAPHIQQLIMESNGKGVTIDGKFLNYAATGIHFGEPGTNGQHSFYQLLHQGRVVPAEFIGFCKSQTPVDLPGEPVSNHDELMSNFFSQPDALAFGKTIEELKAENTPEELLNHKFFPGNRPSSQFLFNELDAFTVGQILAIYEHRTVVEGFLWDVNSFDQWGVELGKALAKQVRGFLNKNREQVAEPKYEGFSFNTSTSAQLKRYCANK